jgi:hypothetical protein
MPTATTSSANPVVVFLFVLESFLLQLFISIDSLASPNATPFTYIKFIFISLAIGVATYRLACRNKLAPTGGLNLHELQRRFFRAIGPPLPFSAAVGGAFLADFWREERDFVIFGFALTIVNVGDTVYISPSIPTTIRFIILLINTCIVYPILKFHSDTSHGDSDDNDEGRRGRGRRRDGDGIGGDEGRGGDGGGLDTATHETEPEGPPVSASEAP